MSGKYTDHTDYVSARVPKRRKVDLEFDKVESRGEKFFFYADGKFICAVEKNYFKRTQIDFFEGIAET